MANEAGQKLLSTMPCVVCWIKAQGEVCLESDRCKLSVEEPKDHVLLKVCFKDSLLGKDL